MGGGGIVIWRNEKLKKSPLAERSSKYDSSPCYLPIRNNKSLPETGRTIFDRLILCEEMCCIPRSPEVNVCLFCFSGWLRMPESCHAKIGLKGHAENAKVWQNGHETWKMNTYFDAPASFFLMGATITQTKWNICSVQCKTCQSRINVPDILFLAGFIIFSMTLKILVVVIPKEDLANNSPAKPSFGMTSTVKCDLLRRQGAVL